MRNEMRYSMENYEEVFSTKEHCTKEYCAGSRSHIIPGRLAAFAKKMGERLMEAEAIACVIAAAVLLAAAFYMLFRFATVGTVFFFGLFAGGISGFFLLFYSVLLTVTSILFVIAAVFLIRRVCREENRAGKDGENGDETGRRLS